MTAALLSGAVLTPVLGRAGDMYGKRRVLLLSLSLMAAGSLICALTSDIGVLIAARALQGAAPASSRCPSVSCATNCPRSAGDPPSR